jgi:phosphatidylserine/phosphatidylglycerophosphate/cardiolipin synthase-like enzyme
LLYIEPYAGAAPITHVINQAQHSINLNVYYLASQKVIDALARANNRGVRVKVIIDGKPYGMQQSSVSKEISRIHRTGASVKVAPPRFEAARHKYVYDHAKYVCSWHECAIGTANFDYSAFHDNREYIYDTKNTAVVTAARSVFNADWNNQRAGNQAKMHLVLSPHSTSDILQVITQAGPVYIESEEMGSDKRILSALEQKGSNAWVILPNTISSYDRKNCARLAAHGVHIAYMPKSRVYIHAKMIVGNLFAFIGSENFTYTSLNKNREMGVILNGSALNTLHKQFGKDWKKVNDTNSASNGALAIVKGWLQRF